MCPVLTTAIDLFFSQNALFSEQLPVFELKRDLKNNLISPYSSIEHDMAEHMAIIQDGYLVNTTNEFLDLDARD